MVAGMRDLSHEKVTLRAHLAEADCNVRGRQVRIMGVSMPLKVRGERAAGRDPPDDAQPRRPFSLREAVWNHQALGSLDLTSRCPI